MASQVDVLTSTGVADRETATKGAAACAPTFGNTGPALSTAGGMSSAGDDGGMSSAGDDGAGDVERDDIGETAAMTGDGPGERVAVLLVAWSCTGTVAWAGGRAGMGVVSMSNR